MASKKTKPQTRTRDTTIRVSVTPGERKELRLAALKADVPLSRFARLLAFAALRKGLSIDEGHCHI
jgi:hypothetical protein